MAFLFKNLCSLTFLYSSLLLLLLLLDDIIGELQADIHGVQSLRLRLELQSIEHLTKGVSCKTSKRDN